MNLTRIMTDNFELAIRVLCIADEIIGQTTDVTFNSCIQSHDFDPDNETEEEKEMRLAQDVHTIYATEENPVKLKAVIDVFMEMQEQFDNMNTGRSFFWQDIEYDANSDMYVVHWGS